MCPVPVSSPGGFLIPPRCPRELYFFWGGGGRRVLAEVAGTRDEATATKTTCHGHLSSRHHHGLLSVFCSGVPCLVNPVHVCPEGPPERPTPLPDGTVRRGMSFPGGGSYVSSLSCVSCVPVSCVLIWFVSCPCLV